VGTFDLLLRSEEWPLARLYSLYQQTAWAALLPREGVDPYIGSRLLRAGNFAAFIGLKEDQTLEAKAHGYEYKGKPRRAWTVELAQDVAAFANSDNGGLLVIGAYTESAGGCDVITRWTPLPHDETREQSHGDIISSHVFPPIRGLRVDNLPFPEGGDVCGIFVPPQPRELLPFLVQGGVMEEGAFDKNLISIVERGQGKNIHLKVGEIHAIMAAGRGLLGQPPSQGEN
jgi:hypothetical protein